jgi:hypothetical protein
MGGEARPSGSPVINAQTVSLGHTMTIVNAVGFAETYPNLWEAER